jgi:hypothetical protein
MKKEIKTDETCCPPFNPTIWDNKVVEWDHKLFIKDSVKTFFYMPINFGSVMTRLMKKVEKSNTETSDYLCLSDHTSKWNMNIYLAVDKKVQDAHNVTLSGKYFCKVYEGPFSETDKWGKEYDAMLNLKGFSIEELYMWYTTCPKCAKKYGKNYVVFVGKIKE